MTSTQARKGIAAFLFGGIALAMLHVAPATARNALRIPDAQIEPTTWSAIDGWDNDDHDAAFAAYVKSCKAILSGAETRAGRPILAGLYKVCEKAVTLTPQKPGEAREFFEQNFRPVKISPLGTPDGFVTGYYEPIVDGRRTQADGYDHPLYRKPKELLPGGRMAIAGAATGKKKVRKRKLVAYHDRAAIEDGILAGRDLEICWLKDPIDSFFAQIQGSVRVLLDDGKLLRLNYQAANGHAYYAIGRWLIDQKIIPKDEMSMDRIREWMERHREAGRELMRRNKSYVFFRETNLSGDDEPIGAQGISLTPGRSIAVDHKRHVYGTPFFISGYLPIEGLKPDTWFRRLMIAQDTGGAIVGPARADLYFGAGDEAASVAGRLRHDAKFVMLVPKVVEPVEPPEDIPLPRPRPANLDALIASAPPSEPAPQTTAAITVPVPEKPAEKISAKPEKASAKPEKEKAATAKPAVKSEKEKASARTGKKDKVAAKPDQKSEPKSATKSAKRKADDATSKKADAKSDKQHGKTAEKPKPKTGKQVWESRVMPVITPDSGSKKSKPKSKTRG